MIRQSNPVPNIPLYTVGHRMPSHYPIMPIAWNMGIGCAVMSYDQQLFVTFVADSAAVADVAVLARFMEEAYAELRTAAGMPAGPDGPHERGHPSLTRYRAKRYVMYEGWRKPSGRSESWRP